MRIAIGADHAAFHMKEQLVSFLQDLGREVVDFGSRSFDPQDDYPDFSVKVARAVSAGQCDLGIVLCGTGVGASITANKVPGIRAALCHDTVSAKTSRSHTNANVLCLGARVIGLELAKEIVTDWLATDFSNGERHHRRLAKIEALEQVTLKAVSS